MLVASCLVPGFERGPDETNAAGSTGDDSLVGGTAAKSSSAAAQGGATVAIPAKGLTFVPVAALSCKALAATCHEESCCTSIAMPGGTYPMGRSESGTDAYSDGDSDEVPEHDATVAEFALDKYEVTVGRFRNFVNAYAGNPQPNAGAHPKAANTGWGESWTPASTDIAATADELKMGYYSYCNWTATAGKAESYPMNCITWYEAFAFCIWDGGRLPTEAEWEYAAAGGSENRLYPWGNDAPDSTRANYNSGGLPTMVVGNKLVNGAGYFNHADLAGSMWEWVFDWYKRDYYGPSVVPNVCENCVNTASSSNRVLRGGSWDYDAILLRAANRNNNAPGNRDDSYGFRCARTP